MESGVAGGDKMKVLVDKIIRTLEDPKKIIPFLASKGCFNFLSDKLYLKLMYTGNTGKILHYNHPERFNEKIQWLKLNDRRDIYTILADKIAVKDYISNLFGEDYIIKTLGVWDKPEDINFDMLPKQFVLKCNHNSGLGMCICKDKTKINTNEVVANLRTGLEQDYYITGREWQYKKINRKVFAEQFMCDDSGHDLKDYKLFIFSGKVKCIQVDIDRFTNHKRNFYDTEWNFIPFTTLYPNDPSIKVEKPECLDTLVTLGETIARNINCPPFLRTDFYVINGKVYFGEVTFHHGSGFEQFYPDEWDYKLGEWLVLPLDQKTDH